MRETPETTIDERGVEEVLLLMQELGMGVEQLGEYVHDVFSERGSDVNNGGADAQIRFLAENHGGFESLKAQLRIDRAQ